jgi:uncharacterized protein
MKKFEILRGRLAAAALIVLSSVMPLSTAVAADDDDRRVRVSMSDVEASNRKVAMAYGALVDMWTKSFSEIGERFAAPRIVRYDRAARTACGVIQPQNAVYCRANNTIYYDQVFVAGMAKIAANAVGTDGDMAAVGIIAHEMGHAVAMQLGHYWRSSYTNEAVADCLAGAFTQQAGKDGSLEQGDVDEAFYGMELAGDPTPQTTGNARYDAIIQSRIARNSHGTKEQRLANFRAGLSRGAGACLAEFR